MTILLQVLRALRLKMAFRSEILCSIISHKNLTDLKTTFNQIRAFYDLSFPWYGNLQ